MHTNPSITSPSPLHSTVKLMVIMVATIQVPVRSHRVPSRTSPAPQDAQTIEVPTNAARSSPEPARALIVVVSAPQMPIRTHSAPVALVIPVKRAQTVEVNTDPSEPSPVPTVTAMEAMIVMVATIQTPIPSDDNPLTSSPSLQQAHTVQMASNATSASPEPPCWPVVMIASPQMPIRSHTSPATLVVSVHCSATVQMDADSAEGSPHPSHTSMMTMVEPVATPQMPIRSHPMPSGSIPALQHTQAVLVPADTTIMVGPEPTTWSIILVATPKMPIRFHIAPTSVVVPLENSQSVLVMANATESSPDPARAPMQAVPVMVTSHQMPVSANVHPARAIPSAQNPQAVQVIANPSIPAPEPTSSLIVMVTTPQVPV